MLLVKRADIFVNLFMRGDIRRRRLSASTEQCHVPAPASQPQSREPVHVMPREILGAEALLAEVERGLDRVAGKPALMVWGDKDPGFRERQSAAMGTGYLPNHRTVVLPRAAHYIQEDAPEEIVAAIKDWWPGEATTDGLR